MSYYDDPFEDDYSLYGEDRAAYDAPDAPRAAPAGHIATASPLARLTQHAFDMGITGSIVAIIVLTALYVLSPLDFVPDVVPVAGQADDIAVVLAGSGSSLFLAVLRYVLRSRVGRWGCLAVIVLSALGALALFVALAALFSRVF